MTKTARLAVDIGGTFTDLVLALPDRSLSAKVLTTSDAPERAVLEGTAAILAQAGDDTADADNLWLTSRNEVGNVIVVGLLVGWWH